MDLACTVRGRYSDWPPPEPCGSLAEVARAGARPTTPLRRPMTTRAARRAASGLTADRAFRTRRGEIAGWRRSDVMPLVAAGATVPHCA